MGVVEINKIATNVWRVRDSTQKINEEKSKFMQFYQLSVIIIEKLTK